MPRILVLNPNSNESVTRGLAEALSARRYAGDVRIECATLSDGPFGIESDADIREVEPKVLAALAARDDCDAFVIACYSDPGLEACRAALARPVFGMQQSAVAAALARGGRYGVLALSQRSIERHRVYQRELGLDSRLAADK